MKPPPSCNCQKSKKCECPIPGKRNQTGVIYQATIISDNGKNTQTYVGLAKKFKTRYSKHKGSIETPSPQNSTALSTHFLKEQEAGNNPTISLKSLKTNIPTYNPVTGVCKFCICETLETRFSQHVDTRRLIIWYLQLQILRRLIKSKTIPCIF